MPQDDEFRKSHILISQNNLEIVQFLILKLGNILKTDNLFHIDSHSTLKYMKNGHFSR
jgi:hypothetical protein